MYKLYVVIASVDLTPFTIASVGLEGGLGESPDISLSLTVSRLVVYVPVPVPVPVDSAQPLELPPLDT
jgi:hypothetical protein